MKQKKKEAIFIKSNLIKIILRAIISISILMFLLTKIDISNLLVNFKNFNPFIYISAFIVLLIHQCLWAYSWKIALEEKKIKLKFKDIYRTVLTSNFFGIFLPSSLGPDIILAFNIGRSLPEKQHAPSSLLFIRIIHIAAVLLVSGTALFFISEKIIIKQIMIFTWFLLLIVWTLYWIALHPFIKRIFEKIFKKYPRYFHFTYKIFHSFSAFGLDTKALTKIWFLGLCMAFLKIFIDYTIALSLGIKIPYLWFLGLVPSISIAGLLPVSIAGLGIREGVYMGLFALLGIATSKSLSISLTVFSLNIMLYIIGGILYLIHGSSLKARHL